MEKLAKSLTIKYALIQSAYWVSQCTIGGFAAVYLHSKNFTNTQIGIVLSVAAILSIILQPLIGGFADKTDKISLKSIILILMFIVFAFALSLFVLPETFVLIAIAYIVIISIQYTLISLMNSLVLEYVNMGIPVNYGLARGISSIAFAVDSLVLGIATNYMGAKIILPIFIISYIVMLIFTWNFKITIPEDLLPLIKSDSAAKTDSSAKTGSTLSAVDEGAPSGIFQFFIKYKKYTLHLIGVTMIFYSHNLVNSYMINIIENVRGTSSDMGLAFAIAATLELPVMAAFIYLIRKIKCSSLLKFAALFFTIKSVVIWLAASVGMVLFSQSLQLFSFAVFTPASMYYVNEIVDAKDRIKGQTMLGVANLSLAGAIGGITGGKILDTFGVNDMLLLGTIVTGIGALIIYFSTDTTPLAQKM